MVLVSFAIYFRIVNLVNLSERLPIFYNSCTLSIILHRHFIDLFSCPFVHNLRKMPTPSILDPKLMPSPSPFLKLLILTSIYIIEDPILNVTTLNSVKGLLLIFLHCFSQC
jgi:hypothetical protein